ncbi:MULTISPECIES: hypothetical protein [Dyadobacter]|uniref:Uncharacterized protein n=2 Tax=Dyadobacter TaxID=120831 RepID=A0A9X1T8M4_9BACT|nr:MULTISPECIES: hypothetical protein [Dyadobacter]MCF0040340.1 hypothetical protein [Dyadobacter fanqingshengii]MCF2494838.1 hypothetical protein [Dyadobacter chenhuakuii]USJ31843.1 hypothetical protein NFI80_03705 [Dyadobacter chenhuakuii]USJ37916.1 hypothetical protein NFI81_09040 [Dyadobacter fanqingshengii]
MTAFIVSACNTSEQSDQGKDTTLISLSPKTMKQIAAVDERYQSYNVETVEVAGGQFWKPYHLMDSLPDLAANSTYDVSQTNDQLYRQLKPLDLTDKRLLILAKGLAPAYVRMSGTWTNGIYFQDNDQPKLTKAPAGFVNVMSRKEFGGLLDFVKATDSKLVTSFAVSNGVRDAQGVWTPKQAQKLADFAKSVGGKIAAAELFNEPTMPTAGGEISKAYNAENFAKDMAAFNAWAEKAVPDMLVLGPGSVGEGSPNVSLQGMGMNILPTEDMLAAKPNPKFDVFSYHYYGAASMRMIRSGPFSVKAENALDAGWLLKTDTVAHYYAGLRDKYNPGIPLWITETAQAAGGGDPFSATFLDTFRYLYQMGSLAKKGVKVIMHNTLIASEYSLIDQDTHLPKPNYWAAYLWAKLMGTQVYETGQGTKGVYVFAHNMKGSKAGVTLLVINTNKKEAPIHIDIDSEHYLLTSSQLEGQTIQLNGTDLKLEDNGELPVLKGKPVKSGELTVPPTSISFFAIPDAGITGPK